MSNKSKKNKKKSAAAKQKAAAAYMSRKTAPVPKEKTQKPVPKPQPNAVDKAQENAQEKTPVPRTRPIEAAKRSPDKPAGSQKAAGAKKTRPKSKKQPLKRKNLRMDRVIAAALVFCVVVAGVVALIFWRSNRFTVPTEAILEYRGTNCSDYEMYAIGENEDAIEQSRKAGEMKRKGDVELFEYYAATKMVVPDKGGSGWLNLTNVFNNKYVLMATIVDEAGSVCAHTRGIPAGYRLGEIKIDYSVPFGEHKMHLVVCAYDKDTRELVGVQYSDLTVQVGTEEVMTDA